MLTHILEEDKTIHLQKGTESLYLSIEEFGKIVRYLMDKGVYDGYLERKDVTFMELFNQQQETCPCYLDQLEYNKITGEKK